MKKILKKKVNNLDFYKIFKPELTPKQMLELGVFGGSYFGLKINEFPKSWFKNAKLSKDFDVSLNNFKKGINMAQDYGGVKNIVIEGHERFWKVKNKSDKILRNWIYVNSIHTIDLLRHFGGDIKTVKKLKHSNFERSKSEFLSLIEFISLDINFFIKFRVSPILISEFEPILTVSPILSSLSASLINAWQVSST